MESTITLTEAKARFSEIVEQAVNGQVFVVTRMGRPVVTINRFAPSRHPPPLGDMRGQIRLSDDFESWPLDVQESLGITEPK